MWNHHQCLFIVLQEVLQPDDCTNIEMVCRFIQKQYIRRGEQCSGQWDSRDEESVWWRPHTPASTEDLCGHLHHLGSESQTLQDIGCYNLRIRQISVGKFLINPLKLHDLFRRSTWGSDLMTKILSVLVFSSISFFWVISVWYTLLLFRTSVITDSSLSGIYDESILISSLLVPHTSH